MRTAHPDWQIGIACRFPFLEETCARQGAAGLTGRVCRGGGASGSTLILDLVLLHLAVEGRTIEAENLRGLLLVPVGALQRLRDRHLLDLGERAMRWNRELLGRAPLFTNRLRQIVWLDLPGLRDEHRALDRVFELAHVARPAVANQQVIGRRRDRSDRLLIPLVEL